MKLFEMDEFQPFEERWNTRQRELDRRMSYYDGSVYRQVGLGSAKDALGWLWPRLYQGIKPLYLPLARAVDIDAGIIPAEWELAEDMPEAIFQAQQLLFDWSRWTTEGVLYGHYGAANGVSGLKICDDRERGRVIVEPVKPACFMLVESGTYDATPSMSIYIDERYDLAGEKFEYAEVITAEFIRTFKDGEPAGFDEREDEYPNELGFVPYVEIKHINTGEVLGEATYQKAIPLLDEVNELASYLADIIKKHAEPQWAAFGVEPSDMVKSGDNIWMFTSPDSKVQPLVAGVDIPGVLDFIREVRDQVFGSLPEVAFDELKSKEQIATATLELQLMELVLKIKRTRPNYDQGLIEAMQLAGRAAATMGVSELSVLDDENLALNSERQILPMDPETANRLEMQSMALERERAFSQPNEGAME